MKFPKKERKAKTLTNLKITIMKKIEDNILELFHIYKERFGFPSSEDSNLRKEFNAFINLEVDYMPHWFVLKLIELDYDVSGNDKLFSIF